MCPNTSEPLSFSTFLPRMPGPANYRRRDTLYRRARCFMTGAALQQRANARSLVEQRKAGKRRCAEKTPLGSAVPFGLMKLVLTKIALYANAANLGDAAT